jgi:hypothetical protein
LGLELPFLPLNPGEYILSCTISDGIHPLALLRATPEQTVLEEKTPKAPVTMEFSIYPLGCPWKSDEETKTGVFFSPLLKS